MSVFYCEECRKLTSGNCGRHGPTIVYERCFAEPLAVPDAGLVERITEEIARNFSTFGGGRKPDSNPLTHWLRDKPLQFALGVDVAAVVEFVLARALSGEPSVGGEEPR
jgi:hypothetical protein